MADYEPMVEMDHGRISLILQAVVTSETRIVTGAAASAALDRTFFGSRDSLTSSEST
jgi:hypothetical protein